MQHSKQYDSVMLSGIRASTDSLHLGHLVGAVGQWKERQDAGQQIFCLVADYQAGTTHSKNPKMIRWAVAEVMKDLGGILDPNRSNVHFVLQSGLPELHEITGLFAQVAQENWNNDIPTIRDERAKQAERKEPITMSFVMYVVSQLGDVMMVEDFVKKAIDVPVGADQVSILRVDSQIARRFTTMYGMEFPEIAHFLSNTARLPALQGTGKMSKSEGSGSIFLKDTPTQIRAKVKMIETDPTRTHAGMPGDPEKNRCFDYLDAFNPNHSETEQLRVGYRDGSVGDSDVKEVLTRVLLDMLNPIREARNNISTAQAQEILRAGTEFVRPHLRNTIAKMKDAMAFNFLDVSPEDIDNYGKSN